MDYRVSPIVLENNKKTLTNVDSRTGWWTSMDNCDAMVVFFAYNIYELEGHFNLLQLGEAKEEPVEAINQIMAQTPFYIPFDRPFKE